MLKKKKAKMSSNHKIKIPNMNFLSTGRVNEESERGIREVGGSVGALKEKHLTSKTFATLQS